MSVKELKTIEEVNALNQKSLMLLDFYNAGCGACRLIAPFLDKLAADYCGLVSMYKFDIDKDIHKVIVSKYQISSLPTIVLIKDQKIVERIVGFRPLLTFKNLIEKHLESPK